MQVLTIIELIILPIYFILQAFYILKYLKITKNLCIIEFQRQYLFLFGTYAGNFLFFLFGYYHYSVAESWIMVFFLGFAYSTFFCQVHDTLVYFIRINDKKLVTKGLPKGGLGNMVLLRVTQGIVILTIIVTLILVRVFYIYEYPLTTLVLPMRALHCVFGLDIIVAMYVYYDCTTAVIRITVKVKKANKRLPNPLILFRIIVMAMATFALLIEVFGVFLIKYKVIIIMCECIGLFFSHSLIILNNMVTYRKKQRMKKK